MAKALAERVSLNLSPTTIVSTLLLTGRRTTMRALRAKPAGVDLGPLRPTMPERLQTKDKLIHLAPDLIVADLPACGDPWPRRSSTTPPPGTATVTCC